MTFLFAAASLWVTAVYLRVMSVSRVLDLDLFHELSLARFLFTQHHFPLADPFAYTPTVFPVIHHEWGTGVLLYPLFTTFGPTSLVLLKFVLVAAILALCLRLVRARGATWPLLLGGCLLAAFLGIVSFPTLRAQFFTLLFVAILLNLLELDRQNRRWWILLWFPLHIVWLNLHGGFIAGIGILAVYSIEQIIRTRTPQWRLIAILAVALALTGINPYGYALPLSVLRGVFLPRPLIDEWGPIYHDAIRTVAYVASLVLLGYAVREMGLRRARGILIVFVAALIALFHTRHASIYAIVWLCYVPAWLATIRKSAAIQSLEGFCRRHAGLLASALVVHAVLLGVSILRAPPWKVLFPTHPGQANNLGIVYPDRAVKFLRDRNFKVNLMTPYSSGSYVSWVLYPNVRVSLDSRYEVAYPTALLPEIQDFYNGAESWRGTLERYPTDLVLVPERSPLIHLLPDEAHWVLLYQDDAYSIFGR
jgi:hypothetical protein